MGRNIASVGVGLIAGMALMLLVQGIGMVVIPLPPGVNFRDVESVKAAMTAGRIPLAFLLVVLFSHGAGSFLAGWVCGRIANHSPAVLTCLVGGLLTLAGIWNLAMIPHPMWFAVVDVLLYIPCAWCGGRLAPPPPVETAPTA